MYDTCMRVRTNIELEDDDVRVIMDRYGIHTKTEAVALALRHLAGQPMARADALAMRGAGLIDHVPVDVDPRSRS
jgi:Arc/MetJ family transcription regulator